MVIDERTGELCRILHLMVSSFVNNVAAIVVAPLQTADGRTFIQIQVDPGDRGKLIGRDGRVADALRQYIRA